MLRSLKALDGFPIMTSDGLIGKVKDIYFDDQRWVVRYLEVDTGGWLSGRRVLVSPVSIHEVDWMREEVIVKLSRKQVEDSPGIEIAKPVSRQHEAELANYYSYPYYWSGPYIWGYTAFPMIVDPAAAQAVMQPEHGRQAQSDSSDDDPHLRSKDEVVGYRIEATDDDIGHVDDFLFNDRDWSISHLVIDTRNWWPGKHVLISPARIARVSWNEKQVNVNLTRSAIEQSPEYDERHSTAAEYEEVYRHAHGFSEMPPFTPEQAAARRQGRIG